MNVDQMTSVLRSYLEHCKITGVDIVKGVMSIPTNTFAVHALAKELHLIGHTPMSDQTGVPQYRRTDDSKPSKVQILTGEGQIMSSVPVKDSVHMFNTLETLILPIKAQDSAATGGDVHDILREILLLVKRIDSRG